MRLLLLLALVSVLSSPSALPVQDAASVRVEVDRTKPPIEYVEDATVFARGVQIYRCEQKEGEAGAWVFVAPEATLYGSEVVGTHSVGPRWRWMDGSAVLGKVLVKQSASEAGAVPWLLLSATPAPETTTGGQLWDVSYVRRAETHGGAEPAAGCDTAHRGGEVRIPYTARYTFYKAAK